MKRLKAVQRLLDFASTSTPRNITEPTAKDKYCRINSGRGYGDEVFEIVQFGKGECRLKSTSGGEVFSMYTAHLHTSIDTKRRSFNERRSAAESIGKPKRKPGKK